MPTILTSAGSWRFASPLLAAAILLPGGRAHAQGEEQELQLVWTCPVHREVTEGGSGTCRLCERDLVETLVREAWSCPIHAVISEPEPGRCPVCRRELYLMTEEVAYACPMHPEERELAPGSCSLCNMPLVATGSTRPHQDHNPKHGGIFFMAPDNWHHLEGTYPEEGVFRVYIYDNFSQPLGARTFEGRAVLEERFDPESRQTHELLASPLLASADGSYLEARVGEADLPREITAKIRLEKDGPFERFDFIFAEMSRDVEAAPATTGRDELLIPDSAVEIAAAIRERNERVRELVRQGGYDRIYRPALEAKELALALESRVEEDEGGAEMRWAFKEIVRAAWLLDGYGDLGNKEKVGIAYELFDRAVETITARYPLGNE